MTSQNFSHNNKNNFNQAREDFNSNITLENKDKHSFAIVYRHITNHPKLSLKAKGLMLYLIDKPDGWNFTIFGIMSQNQKESRYSIRKTLNELRSMGFVKITKVKNEHGKFAGYLWKITQFPENSKNISEIRNSDFGNSDVGKTNPLRKNQSKKNSLKENPPPKGSSKPKRDVDKPKPPDPALPKKAYANLGKRIEEEEEFSREEINFALYVAIENHETKERIKNMETYVRKVLQSERDKKDLQKKYKKWRQSNKMT